MTASFAQLRQWRCAGLDAAAAAVRREQMQVARVQQVMAAADGSLSSWQGGAAAAASTRHTEIAAVLVEAMSGLDATGRALTLAATEVVEVQRLVQLVESLCDHHGLMVDAAGTVVPRYPQSLDLAVHEAADPVTAAQQAWAAAVVRGQAQAAVAAAQQRAAVLEADLVRALAVAFPASALPELTNGTVAATDLVVAVTLLASGSSALSPGTVRSLDPTRRALWWAGLSSPAQEQLIVDAPELIGAGDGLPGWARDRANRNLLDRYEGELRDAVAGSESGPDDAPTDWWSLTGEVVMGGGASLFVARSTDLRARTLKAEREDKLASLKQVRAVLDQDDGRTRQLLSVDVSGRLATAVVSTGDVDTAGRLAVFVGGLSTTVNGDLARHEKASAGLVDVATRDARAAGDGSDVAVVTWLGYQAPQWSDTVSTRQSVLLPDAAQAAAPVLAGFVSGLSVARSKRVPVTVVGHSYGSTVAGLAAAQLARSATPSRPTPVTDIVVAGSPGLGVARTSLLGVEPSRVHVIETSDDAIADSGWLGPQPDHLPGVDVLSADTAKLPGGVIGAPSDGHSEYFNDGTTSQWNVAAVIAGTPGQTVKATPCLWDDGVNLGCRLRPTG